MYSISSFPQAGSFPSASSPVSLDRRLTASSIKEMLIHGGLFLCAFLSVLTTAGIVYVLLSEAYEFFSHVGVFDFLTGTRWSPQYLDKQFGILPLLTGTLMIAAMKSIVRKDTGEDWETYVRRLAEAEGVEISNDNDLRKFDRKRKGKKTSNTEWESPGDPDARIMKMKKGHTHLSYKQEHVVDLETEAILSVEVYHGNQSDADTLEDSVNTAQGHLVEAGSEAVIEEAVADKGYHKNQTLATCREQGLRTYVCEPDGPPRRWTDKPDGYEAAYRANRRRLAGERNKQLQKLRCERVERSFAHVCETGGGRRTQLRGLDNNRKQADLRVAAHNLGLILRKLLGSGKPREFAGLFGLLLALFSVLQTVCNRPKSLPGNHRSTSTSNSDGETSRNVTNLIPAFVP